MKSRTHSATSHTRLHSWHLSKTQMAQYLPDLRSISIGIFDGEFEDAQTRQQQLQQLGVHKCLQSAYQRLFFH